MKREDYLFQDPVFEGRATCGACGACGAAVGACAGVCAASAEVRVVDSATPSSDDDFEVHTPVAAHGRPD